MYSRRHFFQFKNSLNCFTFYFPGFRGQIVKVTLALSVESAVIETIVNLN